LLLTPHHLNRPTNSLFTLCTQLIHIINTELVFLISTVYKIVKILWSNWRYPEYNYWD